MSHTHRGRRLWKGSGAPTGPALGREGRCPRSTRRPSSLSFGTGASGRQGVYTTEPQEIRSENRKSMATECKRLTLNTSCRPQFSFLPWILESPTASPQMLWGGHGLRGPRISGQTPAGDVDSTLETAGNCIPKRSSVYKNKVMFASHFLFGMSHEDAVSSH